MKRIFTFLVFILLVAGFVAAQGNGGGNGNSPNGGQGNGNSNNGNPPGGGMGGWAWGNSNWPNLLIQQLENGGPIPNAIALGAIWKAREWGQQTFGLSYGQMVARYAQGSLTVTYVSTAPPALVFNVAFDGGNIAVILTGI